MRNLTILRALDWLDAHPGGKYRCFNWEEGRKPTISLNFDSQAEAETWASVNLGETYRETAIYSDACGYLAHDFKGFTFYAHFPKEMRDTKLEEQMLNSTL